MKYQIEYWGPACWKWLHTASIQRETIYLLVDLLPCAICRTHLADYVHTSPPPRGRGPLKRWLVQFHDTLNTRLGKDTIQTPRTYQESVDGFIEFILVVSLTHSDKEQKLQELLKQGCLSLGIPYTYKKKRPKQDSELFINVFSAIGSYSSIYKYRYDLVLMDYIPTKHRSRFRKLYKNKRYYGPRIIGMVVITGLLLILLLYIVYSKYQYVTPQ